MYIIRIIAVNLIIGSAFLVGCKTEGALTPEEAYKKLRDAYTRKDAGAVVDILSTGSSQKVKEIIKMMATMDEVQLKSLSERFAVTVDELKNLTVKDYMALQFSIGEKIGEDILKEIIRCDIIGVDVDKDTALVRVANGMELTFVKEGKYWKFNMKDL